MIDHDSAAPHGKRSAIERNAGIHSGFAGAEAIAHFRKRQQPCEAEKERELGGKILIDDEVEIPR